MARIIDGEAVRRFRELAGISQRELGRRCEVDHSTIRRVENQAPRGFARAAALEHKLADILGVPVESITLPLEQS